ncbi:hypothetical protein [Flavobacterium frigoris]|uniref:Secreted hyalin domain protein n=1 Tax=Flavobacterium frigoris (strain PS1) TaxID=1086011 RepID=H7FWM4_FLAFP|nr:hypothetical protein [Flavobacterium frigoris]EIA07103.1 secreted hyalin domain protein [Flavobacterium frigoris PS1]
MSLRKANLTEKRTYDISDYVGQKDLRIKFTFKGTTINSTSALDQIKTPSHPAGPGIVWTDENQNVIGNTITHSETPLSLGLYNYAVTMFLNGCVYDITPSNTVYIPVGQGFFVNASLNSTVRTTTTIVQGGTLSFKNSQRKFERKSSGNSLFIKQTKNTKSKEDEKDIRLKVRLGFESTTGSHRQLLVGVEKNTSNQFDIGYDAPMFVTSKNDIYWELDDNKFVIQAVPNFNNDQIIPFGLIVVNTANATIKIDELENIPQSLPIYLCDNLTSIYYDIKDNPFTISLAIGEYKSRFSLRFSDKTLNIENNFLEVTVDKIFLFKMLGKSIANWAVKERK